MGPHPDEAKQVASAGSLILFNGADFGTPERLTTAPNRAWW
jgi:hypothetical protein